MHVAMFIWSDNWGCWFDGVDWSDSIRSLAFLERDKHLIPVPLNISAALIIPSNSPCIEASVENSNDRATVIEPKELVQVTPIQAFFPLNEISELKSAFSDLMCLFWVCFESMKVPQVVFSVPFCTSTNTSRCCCQLAFGPTCPFFLCFYFWAPWLVNCNCSL